MCIRDRSQLETTQAFGPGLSADPAVLQAQRKQLLSQRWCDDRFDVALGIQLKQAGGPQQLVVVGGQDQHAPGRAGPPAAAPEPLQQRGDGPRRAHLQHPVEVADVDTQLEGRGGDDDAVAGLDEGLLRLPSFVDRERGVGHEGLRAPVPKSRRERLDGTAGVGEDQPLLTRVQRRDDRGGVGDGADVVQFQLGRPLQRVGLSATVGNPQALLRWLQGPRADTRRATVVAPPSPPSRPAELELDYVGTIANAATVIASLHAGEKRLVFADSRRTVETLAARLRDRGTQTFVSHSSLSADERRQAEQAFVEARDCVIVSTSTLELGVDVGDLDRVLQVGAPRTLAALLQRLGRSGRRAGTTRSMLVLATDDDELLRAAGLLQLDAEGCVEPVVAPSRPLHLLAQQLLALCLQHGRVGRQTWTEGLGGLELGTVGEASRVTDWMLATGHVDSDSGMLFI